jgi:hypothetical protein
MSCLYVWWVCYLGKIGDRISDSKSKSNCQNGREEVRWIGNDVRVEGLEGRRVGVAERVHWMRWWSDWRYNDLVEELQQCQTDERNGGGVMGWIWRVVSDWSHGVGDVWW